MALSALTTFSQLLLKIYGMAQTVPIAGFQNSALQATQMLLPFTSAMWGTATMTDQGINIHTLHLHNTTMQMIQEYESVKHLDHFAQETSAKEKATIRFSMEEARAQQLRDFLCKFGHLHGLITHSIDPQTRFTQWLSLFRNDANDVYTASEAELLDSLFPHLMQALAINRKVYLECLIGDESREKWTVAIADRFGVLYHADPGFIKVTQDDVGMPGHDRLPDSVLQAVTGGTLHLTGKQSVIVGSLENDLLFLKARLKVPADMLSQREYTIAKMLAGGLSLKEIAQKLGRSPETIRTHGKSIYAKLGTNKVTQLPSLLSERD